jgi:hypothetical protein
MDAIGLPVDVEFQIHAASIAIQNLDREELEEAFIEMLHQKALDRQMFLSVLKDHGIDADISQLSDKFPKYHARSYYSRHS